MLGNIEFCYITDITDIIIFMRKIWFVQKPNFILLVKSQGDVQNILKAMDYS